MLSVTHGHHHSLFPVSGGVLLQFAWCHCLGQKLSHLAPLAETYQWATINVWTGNRFTSLCWKWGFIHPDWSCTGPPSLSGQTSPPESPPLRCGCLGGGRGGECRLRWNQPHWGPVSEPGPAWSVGTVGTCAWFRLPRIVASVAAVLSLCSLFSWQQ